MVEVLGSRKQSWADAAQRSGYGFTSKSSGLGLTGWMFRHGERTTTSGVVDALGAERPFMAGTVTGHYVGMSAVPQVLTSSFLAIPLTRPLPGVVLLARGLGLLARSGRRVDDDEQVPLDGSFGRTFTLYSPEGTQRDALAVFSPPVMDKLVAATGGCDVEVVGDWMYVYSLPGRYRTAAALHSVEELVASVRAALNWPVSGPEPARVTPPAESSRALLWLVGGLGALFIILVARLYSEGVF